MDQALEKARELAELREDAAVRLYYPEKEPIPPMAEPIAAVRYALDSFRMLSDRVIVLLPWVEL